MKNEQQIINEFHQAITEAFTAIGCTPPAEIMADDKIYRFKAHDKDTKESGRYKLKIKPDDYGPGFYGLGWFEAKGRLKLQNWNSGKTDTGQTMTPEQRAEQEQRIREHEAKQDQKRRDDAEIAERATQQAAELYAGAEPVTEPGQHEYLIAKRLPSAPGGLRVDRKTLLIPVYNEAGQIQTVQKIFPDPDTGERERRFHRHTSTKNGFLFLGEKGEVKKTGIALIAEGYATAATIHHVTELPVFVGFSADGLLPVAEMIRRKYPDVNIIICGDNDKSGVGQQTAQQAAEATNSKFIIPAFNPGEYGDYNDLYAQQGAETMTEQIKSQITQAQTVATGGGASDTSAESETQMPHKKKVKAGFLEQRKRDGERMPGDVIGLRIPRFSEEEPEFKPGLFETAFDGLQPGFYIVAAETNIGKTAFLTNLCLNILRCKENLNSRLLYLSMDDEKNIILYRFLAILSCISLPDLRRKLEDKTVKVRSNIDLRDGTEPENKTVSETAMQRKERADNAEKEIMKLLDRRLMVYDISDEDSNSMERAKVIIRQAAEDAQKDGEQLFVAIDGLYNLEVGNTGGSIREANIERANQLKGIVDTYKIPLITTGEIKKSDNGDKPREPSINDLMETSKFAYNASAVIMLAPGCDDMEKFRESDRVHIKATVVKNKLSSFKGRINLLFEKAEGRIYGEYKPKPKQDKPQPTTSNGNYSGGNKQGAPNKKELKARL